MVRDVYATMAPVIDCVSANIASDLVSGGALLLAGAEGAFLNVRINAGSLKDKDLAATVMQRAMVVLEESCAAQANIVTKVDGLLG